MNTLSVSPPTLERRFFFRGHAIGIAGHITYPQDEMILARGCSAVPAIGGRAESDEEAWENDFVQVQSISTKASGDFVEREPLRLSYDRVSVENLVPETRTEVEIQGLTIADRVSVDLMKGGMESTGVLFPLQSPIRPFDICITGVKIDNYPLRVVLATQVFANNDTYAKLERAYDDSAAFRARYGKLFFSPDGPLSDKLPESHGVVYCTMVDELAWEGTPHPNATIVGNSVVIPDYGVVYFAEMLISRQYRRFIMLRARLGSSVGGDARLGSSFGGHVVAMDVETNGTYWPF